jgi:hypothetical protein
VTLDVLYYIEVTLDVLYYIKVTLDVLYYIEVTLDVRGVARYKMKCRHNLRWGVGGRLRPPAGPPGGGFSPQLKTIISIKWRHLNNKRHEIYSYSIMKTIQKSKLLIYFCWIWEVLNECFYTAFHNNFNSYKNSASQSIESIAKIIINAKCTKETFPETFKE